MIPWSNSIPLIFLGLICGGFIVAISWKAYSKRRRNRNGRRNDVDNESVEEAEDYYEVLDIRRTETKKRSRVPKMWDVQVPWNAKPSLDEDDYDEDDIMKAVARWRSITPMSVSYIKHVENPPSYSLNPLPTQAHDTLIPSHQSSSQVPTSKHHQAPAYDPRRTSVGYNKNDIQAVQVSVMISLPRPPDKRGAAAGSQLALGVAKVDMEEMNKGRKNPRNYSTTV